MWVWVLKDYEGETLRIVEAPWRGTDDLKDVCLEWEKQMWDAVPPEEREGIVPLTWEYWSASRIVPVDLNDERGEWVEVAVGSVPGLACYGVYLRSVEVWR